MAGKPGAGRISPRDKVVALRTIAQMGLPPAPKDFTKAEAAEWNDIVVTYPADRFPRSTWPMLEGYCTHAVQRRLLAARIHELHKDPDYSLRDYNLLLTMHDRESKAVASFGVRLGIARTSMTGRHNNDPDTIAEHNLPWAD